MLDKIEHLCYHILGNAAQAGPLPELAASHVVVP
jgi:hypothetical protein